MRIRSVLIDNSSIWKGIQFINEDTNEIFPINRIRIDKIIIETDYGHLWIRDGIKTNEEKNQYNLKEVLDISRKNNSFTFNENINMHDIMHNYTQILFGIDETFEFEMLISFTTSSKENLDFMLNTFKVSQLLEGIPDAIANKRRKKKVAGVGKKLPKKVRKRKQLERARKNKAKEVYNI